MPEPSLQAGFSPSHRLAAQELAGKIQAGIPVPLEELRLFILASHADLAGNRVKALPKNTPLATKPTGLDLDFF